MAHKNGQLRSFHLFAGAGGGILADKLLGHRVVGACEIEQYPREVLLQRQRDGIIERFPIWDDVCTLDGKPWRGSVDILCGGFPCQDISSAGKGEGITGARSGLWKEYKRLIGEMRPKFVFAENSPLLRIKGLVTVLQDLAELGYDARWCVLGAWHVGAPHKRNRMWVLAYSNMPQRERGGISIRIQKKYNNIICSSWWKTEPDLGRVVDGMATKLDSKEHAARLKAIGNGQVPVCAATAQQILMESIGAI